MDVTRRPSCALSAGTLFGLVQQIFPQFRDRDNKNSILCLIPLGSCLLDCAGGVLRTKEVGDFHLHKNSLISKTRKAKISHSFPATTVRKYLRIKNNIIFFFMDNAQIENKKPENVQKISGMTSFFQNPYSHHSSK